MMPLSNKSILVTGAGQGIGAEIAVYAASLGARIVVNDIDSSLAAETVERIRTAGGVATVDVSDISTWQGAEAAVSACCRAFGSINGLVNNAGVWQGGTADEMTEEGIRFLVEVNVLGTLFCTNHAVKRMRAADGGSIVNVTSAAQCGLPAMSTYSATKGACASFTYACAVDYSGLGIRVNAISPKAQTRMGIARRAYHARKSETISTNTLLPSNNAPAACFLLSDQAAGIDGQVFLINDGAISVMTHPALLGPPASVPGMTWEAVVRAFQNDLQQRAVPIGVVTV